MAYNPIPELKRKLIRSEPIKKQAKHALEAGSAGAVAGIAELARSGGNLVAAVATGMGESTEELRKLHKK